MNRAARLTIYRTKRKEKKMSEDKKLPIDNLLGEIFARREERGFLARLRRGLNEDTEDQAWPSIVRRCRNFSDAIERKIWLTVAGLAAIMIPAELNVPWNCSIGTLLGRQYLEEKKRSGKKEDDGKSPYEIMLRKLLNSHDSSELCESVVGVVRSAERKGLQLNCRGLFLDLMDWNDEVKRDRVRLQWTRDFYGLYEKEDNDGEGAPVLEEEA